MARALQVLRRDGWRGVRHRLTGLTRLARHRVTARKDSTGSHYGVRLTPNWGDATFRMYVKGSYGAFYADHLRARTQPFCFLDIGANQGLYTLIAGQNPACAHAIAFEPVPHTADLLRRNLLLNPTNAPRQVVEAAISDRAGVLSIATSPGHSGAASIGARPVAQGDGIRINAIGPAELGAMVLPPAVPILAKLDVEGHELIALRALLDSALGPRVVEVYYECDEDWVDPSEIRALLSAQGFTHRRRIGGARHYNMLADRPLAADAAP